MYNYTVNSMCILSYSIGKMWNALRFEIERPTGNRIRGAQREGFLALLPQGAFHLKGARIPRLTKMASH